MLLIPCLHSCLYHSELSPLVALKSSFRATQTYLSIHFKASTSFWLILGDPTNSIMFLHSTLYLIFTILPVGSRKHCGELFSTLCTNSTARPFLLSRQTKLRQHFYLSCCKIYACVIQDVIRPTQMVHSCI